MTEDLQFIRKHTGKGAVVDACLLVVYCVGKYDPNLMLNFSHTKQYAEDFPLIVHLIERFKVVYTTPNILTEVSSLGKKLGPPFYDVLKPMISVLDERYCASTKAAETSHFPTIGLSDSGIMTLAQEGMLVLTVDWPLYSILRSKDLDAVNVNRLRPYFWNGNLE